MKDDLFNYLESTISDDLWYGFIETLNTDPEEWKKWFEIFKYQGYGPLEFKSYLESIFVEITDIRSLLYYYCCKGTKYNKKTLAKCTKELRDTINKWVNIYGLSTNPDSPTTVTISRVAAAYLEEVAEILIKRGSECRIFNFKDVTIPTYLRFSSAPSILLNEDEFKDWLKWAVENDKIINPEKSNMSNVEKFGRISFNSSLHDEASRKRIREHIESLT
ncbi:hypothetical protein AYI69_g6662 [Smittium culicis]|uniref:Uncharacterized protein n=1 Tax=Smittium culicis TaxID=133412 RepID=A0A1R1XXP9_9FUNG|nr:hypothetical protein AYI69_g6662 [Smittium culicis]